MLIDWFTVAAQALNFLILVWLLKRFLYQPILNAIDSREKLIASELADAAAKKTEAQKDRDDFQHKNDEFDSQRDALLSKAKADAETELQRLLGEAGKAADNLSTKRHESLIKEFAAINGEISRRAEKEVFAITRKTLTDLAGASLEEKICEVFINRLQKLDDNTKKSLADALKNAPDPAIVRSVFELPLQQQTAIQKALDETFSAKITLHFETAPDLVSGIELKSNGQKVAWSIADYLTSLETGVQEILNKNTKIETKPDSPPSPKTDAAPEKKSDLPPAPATVPPAETAAAELPEKEQKAQKTT